MSSNITEIDYSFLDNDSKELKSIKNSNFFKHSLTTFNGGFYSICVKNNRINNKNSKSEDTATISFNIKQGIAAKDYSAVTKLKDFKPLELSV